MENLYCKAHRLQKEVLQNPQLTHIELLRKLEPYVAKSYGQVLNQRLTLKDRFCTVTNDLYRRRNTSVPISSINTKEMLRILKVDIYPFIADHNRHKALLTSPQHTLERFQVLGRNIQAENEALVILTNDSALDIALLLIQPSLKQVDLRGCDSVSPAWIHAIHLPLSSLDLWFQYIGDEGAKGYLLSNNIGEEGAMAIAKALETNITITTLYLSSNNIGEECSNAVKNALKENKVLTSLDIRSDNIEEEDAKDVAKFLKTKKILTSLDKLLDDIREYKTHTTLYLSSNNIREEGAKAVAKALKINSPLILLDLSSNNIGEAGAKAIAKALEANRTLIWLDMSLNDIGDEGAKVLETNEILNRLNLLSVAQETFHHPTQDPTTDSNPQRLASAHKNVGQVVMVKSSLAKTLSQDTTPPPYNLAFGLDPSTAQVAAIVSQELSLTSINLDDNGSGTIPRIAGSKSDQKMLCGDMQALMHLSLVRLEIPAIFIALAANQYMRGIVN
ncbi:hypothetical protein BC936DRAFT_139321 [Jimgerdemannia flammicorona]|uniref:RNI-like protein n=1 Tax=Jimgerdemannia flammicorona TaxID=994334 RepID=A0A433DMT2_9FUNG|nr:hypothetical protein BC936DRAFT_139321 [Jimgerdemannia flammicorona]